MIIIGTKEEIEAMIEDSCPYPYPMPMNSCNNDCRACWNRSASIVIIRPEKVGTVEKALADRPHGECRTCKHFVKGGLDGKTYVCEHPCIELDDYFDYACIAMEESDFCSQYEKRGGKSN